MKKNRLTENNIKCLTNRLTKTVLKEVNDSYAKENMINKISRGTQDFTSKLFRDTAWENVSDAFQRIKDIVGNEGELEVNVKNGGYRKGTDGQTQFKEYNFNVQLNNGMTIEGILTCYQAGTVQDPWSAYDMAIQMW